jgi:hypothetical protein
MRRRPWQALGCRVSPQENQQDERDHALTVSLRAEPRPANASPGLQGRERDGGLGGPRLTRDADTRSGSAESGSP